jgi:hypothetical protein
MHKKKIKNKKRNNKQILQKNVKIEEKGSPQECNFTYMHHHSLTKSPNQPKFPTIKRHMISRLISFINLSQRSHYPSRNI